MYHQKDWKTEKNLWDWDKLDDAFEYLWLIFFEKSKLVFDHMKKYPLYANPVSLLKELRKVLTQSTAPFIEVVIQISFQKTSVYSSTLYIMCQIKNTDYQFV